MCLQSSKSIRRCFYLSLYELSRISYTQGGIHAHALGRMVCDASVPLDGLRHRWRAIRTHRADTPVACVATIVLRDYTTRDWSPPAKVLDSRPCSHHALPHFVAVLNVEAAGGASSPAHWARIVYYHACLERSLLHPRDAGVSKSASGLPAICRTVSESRELDFLDVV